MVYVNSDHKKRYSSSRFAKIFNFIFSGFLFVLGILVLFQSIIGGFLIITSSLVFFFFTKNYLINISNTKLFNVRSLNLLSIIFFIVGISYTMIQNTDKRLSEDWGKNNSTILMKLSQDLEDGQLISAKFDIEKYESVAKNDPTFKELKENYKKLYAAQEAKKKTPESKQNDLSEQEKILAERLKLGARCAGFYSKWGPGSIENCRIAANSEPLSKTYFDNAVQCDAYQSKSWYDALLNGKSDSGTFSALAKYLNANRDIYEDEYRIGVSKNQGSYMDLETSGKCRDYMSTTREAFSKQR